MSIFSRTFTFAALERALKTAAQVAIIAIVGTGAYSAQQVNAFSVDWGAVLGAAVGGFILSYLTSVASAHLGKWEGPSLTDEAIIEDEIVAEVEE